MKRSRIIIWVIILFVISLIVAGAIIIWKTDLYTTMVQKIKSSEQPSGDEAGESETEKAASGVDSNEPNKPAAASDAKQSEGGRKKSGGRGRRGPHDPNTLGEPNDPNKLADPNKPAEPNEPNEPNEISDPMEALNLKGVQVKDLIAKLADWTGKVIITSEDVMKQKITIYSANEVPRSRALTLIYSALRAKGFIAEFTDDAIYLKPIKEAKLGAVPTISDEQPLEAIENKNQIVQKFFKLKNYSPTQMSQILLPLVGEYGYLSADENAKTLLVIDSIENLIRFKRVISQFDVPEAEQTVTEFFRIRDGDPGEIVEVLKMLLGQKGGKRQSSGPKGSSTCLTTFFSTFILGFSLFFPGPFFLTAFLISFFGPPLILELIGANTFSFPFHSIRTCVGSTATTFASFILSPALYHLPPIKASLPMIPLTSFTGCFGGTTGANKFFFFNSSAVFFRFGVAVFNLVRVTNALSRSCFKKCCRFCRSHKIIGQFYPKKNRQNN